MHRIPSTKEAAAAAAKAWLGSGGKGGRKKKTQPAVQRVQPSSGQGIWVSTVAQSYPTHREPKAHVPGRTRIRKPSGGGEWAWGARWPVQRQSPQAHPPSDRKRPIRAPHQPWPHSESPTDKKSPPPGSLRGSVNSFGPVPQFRHSHVRKQMKTDV